MSARKRESKGRSSASTADAAARLAEIVEAAERAATKVIDDAETQAGRIVEEARARADGVVAERLRELADELDPGAGVEVDVPAPVRRLEPVEPPAEGDEGEEVRPRRSGSAGARLLATQMAVSGAEREEIEERLRSGFEIEDAGEILDAILGPEE
jgi:cell division septum initiation protein DivIVA